MNIEPIAPSEDINLSGLLDLNPLRDECKSELIEILSSLRGRKCLVSDTQLSCLLNQIVVEGSKVLKDNGVQYFRELNADLGDFVSEGGRDVPDSIVYLVRPELSSMKLIAKQVQACIKSGMRCQYHVYFVPHRTVVCEQILEDEGVLQHLEIGEFHIGFIPFDNDLLSLEMSGVFKQCYVDGDTSSLNASAKALLKIQDIFGTIPFVKSKGAASRKVLQKLMHLRREEESNNSNSHSHSHGMFNEKPNISSSLKSIDTLVVMDREVDLISPMVTPLTYEGLIDEIVEIQQGKIRLDPSLLGDENDETLSIKMPPSAVGIAMPEVPVAPLSKRNPGEKVSIALNNSDIIYSEIRDLSIERIGSFLQERAISIRKRYANFRENKDASLSEIHDFVKKIPALTKEYKALNQHIHIAELLKQTTDSREFREQWQAERGILEGETYLDQIEDIMCSDTDRSYFFKVLRMLCIQSISAGGIRSNRYDPIKRLIVQTYGYDQLFTLNNLERAGLLKRKDLTLVEGSSLWQGLRIKLKLIDERVNTLKPTDISYVAAGYAPLSVRLVQSLATNTWSSMTDVMRALPGPLLEFTQLNKAEELTEAIARCNTDNAGMGSSNSNNAFLNISYDDSQGSKRVMLLFVVGGLTFLEIAALRYLSNDPSYPYTIIMATTKLITGSTLLRSMVHTFK